MTIRLILMILGMLLLIQKGINKQLFDRYHEGTLETI